MKKKKILFHSNNSRAFTGFGKNAKNIMKYLSNTGKYEIIEAANGIRYNDPSLKFRPWKAFGTLPEDPNVIKKLNQDPALARQAGYGVEMIDEIIKKERPDLYLGVEDIWAFEKIIEKRWWNKTNSMIWTTLDSLPILPLAEKSAEKIKNYYVWASFAEKALKNKSHDHVKTLRGSIDTSLFKKLEKDKRLELRKSNKIPKSSFVIGFVFRNQLRKSVPNLLDGFSLFCKQHPESNARLLLHTSWEEGWDIPRLLKEKNIDNNLILTTYFCDKCNKYEVMPFSGHVLDCDNCGAKKNKRTTGVSRGVSEEQLNEIYNMMDVYCHPFTSGGQEIPIQEAKLCELITLVTNYSCGEDCCTEESGGIPLKWTEYREPGTQFIKASTSPGSIRNELSKVYKMDASKKTAQEKKSREFVIKNYSIEAIGKQLESIIDSLEEVDWDFDFEEKERNSSYVPEFIESDSEFLIDIYKNILNISLDENDDGHKHWMSEIKKGASRESILKYFRSVAIKENKELIKTDIRDLFKDSKNEVALFVLNGKHSDVFNSTAILDDFSKKNPNIDLYYCCNPAHFDILNGNPNIFKTIPYAQEFENENIFIGHHDNKPIVKYHCVLNTSTDKFPNYISM